MALLVLIAAALSGGCVESASMVGPDADGEVTDDDAEADASEPEPLVVRPDGFQLFHHDDLVGRDGAGVTGVRMDDGGSQLPIVEGYQRANMVLVGFRTDAAFVEPMDVELRLEVEGRERGRVTWAFQRFHDTDDRGWRSIYDLYIALDGCDVFEAGSAGVFTIAVTDKFGRRYERHVDVVLGEHDLCHG